MKSKRLIKWSIFIVIVLIIGASLGIMGYIYTEVQKFDQIFANNVYIEGISVGGLTKEQVKAELDDITETERSSQSIILYNHSLKYEIPSSNLGITYNTDEIINKAFSIGHNGSLYEKYQVYKDGLKKKQEFVLEKTYDTLQIEAAVKGGATTFYIEPVNATFERKDRQFITTKEKVGQALDTASTFAKVMDALSDPAAKTVEVEAVLEILEPEFTEASFIDIQTLIGTAHTDYSSGSVNRNENLKVAAQKISRTLLPGETFYLSEQLEPFTVEAGYKNAGVIVNGKIEDGLGGGVCQVASTLYNAILRSGLEIVTRQNHSLPVGYVQLGLDATYASGGIDFQFKNSSEYPVFIDAYCENNQVKVDIYGHKELKSPYDIQFSHETIEVIPAPATKYVDDPTLEFGKEVEDIKALTGYKVKSYKLYYKDGALVDKEYIDMSYYKPRAAVIKRGTKGADAATANGTVNPSTQVPQENLTTPSALQPTNPITDPVITDPIITDPNVINSNTPEPIITDPIIDTPSPTPSTDSNLFWPEVSPLPEQTNPDDFSSFEVPQQ